MCSFGVVKKLLFFIFIGCFDDVKVYPVIREIF